jgi:transcriptional regulator with XRE-family HTH domain
LDYSNSDFYSGLGASTDVDKSITSRAYKVFLRELRSARRKSGLTQVDLAAKLGETQSFVSKCERGERRIDVVELRVFCEAFSLPFPKFAQRLERVLSNLKD